MTKATINRRCPGCGRRRKFQPSEHGYASGRKWERREDGLLVCYLCVARATPGGEAELREKQAELRNRKKVRRRLEKKTGRLVGIDELNAEIEAAKRKDRDAR